MGRVEILLFAIAIGILIFFKILFSKSKRIKPKKTDLELYSESLERSNFYLNRQFKFLNEKNWFMTNYYDSLMNIEEEKRYVLDSIKVFK